MRDQTELLPSLPAVWSFLCTSVHCQANLPLQTQINTPLLPLLITAQCTAYGSCMLWFEMTSLLGRNNIKPRFPTLQFFVCLEGLTEFMEQQNSPPFLLWVKTIDFHVIYCMSVLLAALFLSWIHKRESFFLTYWPAIISKCYKQSKKNKIIQFVVLQLNLSRHTLI